MVKSYLRYEPRQTFGLVTGFTSNVELLSPTLVVCPALEEAVIWDLKKGEVVSFTIWSCPLVGINVEGRVETKVKG